MSRLEELIEELCPNGVEWKELGEILINGSAKLSIQKKDYKEYGKYPIIDQSKNYIAGYANNKLAIPPIIPCIIFGDHTRIVKYANKQFAQGDSGTKVFIVENSLINTKYIYYVFSNINILSRGYNRHWSFVKQIKIPIPPLEIQEEIVRILDTMTNLIDNLEIELEKRKKQYEYYRDTLLTFGDDVAIVKLKDIAEIYRGGNFQKKDFRDFGFPCIHYGQIYTKYGIKCDSTISYIDKDVYDKSKKAQKNDIIMAVTSENIEDICKCLVWFGDDYVAISGHTAIIRHNQNPLYLAYYFNTSMFYTAKKRLSHGTKVIEITPSSLLNIEIPLPPLSEQERIVSILDRFDKLCNDITKGIPAEIEARRKQYEYYRDKLLTFKDIKENK